MIYNNIAVIQRRGEQRLNLILQHLRARERLLHFYRGVLYNIIIMSA